MSGEYSMTPKILVIDSDVELTDLVEHYLKAEKFEVDCVHDGEQGLKKALNQPFDLIVLDVMLPKKNGFIILQQLREHLTTPVLLLTARTDDIDRIIGLELGADDYLLKPCNPRELLARIRAILRRIPKTLPTRGVMTQSNIVLDAARRLVQKAGESIELTATEFNILEMLMRSPGQAFSKEELTEYVLGRKFNPYDRSIDVHISHLRNKLGENIHQEPMLKTVRGFGYIFNE
jgi:two-component system response regulator CpxR